MLFFAGKPSRAATSNLYDEVNIYREINTQCDWDAIVTKRKAEEPLLENCS
jgi:hypothetical protein